MRATVMHRMIVAIGISAVALCGPAVTARADPPQDKKQHDQKDHKPQGPKPANQKGHEKSQPQPHAQPKPPQPQGHQSQAREQHPPPQAQAHDRKAPEQSHGQPRRAEKHEAPPIVRQQPTHVTRQEETKAHGRGRQNQEQRVQARQPEQQVRVASQVRPVRLAPQQQQALISQQQRRVMQYSAALSQQRRVAEQQTVVLQRQRPAQYSFMQGYVARLRQQESELQDQRNYNYWNDPYFYTPPDYRYYWDGQYYETNQYGVSLLRRALNDGYREGWQAGRADQLDHWPFDYRSSYAYRDANYGYNGYYLDRGTYNYYFREGFRRGYEDGYSNGNRYGRYANGNGSLLGSIVTALLRLQSIR